MKYLRAYWIHQFEDEPVLYFHEIDDDNYEIRRVEFYPNRHFKKISKELETDLDFLSPEPIPAVDKINEDPEFKAEWISEDSFKEIWNAPQLGLAMLSAY